MWASFSRKPPKFVMKNEFREKILLALKKIGFKQFESMFAFLLIKLLFF